MNCGGNTVDYPDADWLCTFSWDGDTGIVYTQNTVVACEPIGMSNIPVYENRGIWLSLSNNILVLDEPEYESGGNHKNNSMAFTYDNLRFRYYHSSFGFGWRSCQPMDCMQVSELDGDIIEDGCTCDRSLPVVCISIQEDGSWSDDMSDQFEVCLGDSTCGQ